jgi:hypothetical protein
MERKEGKGNTGGKELVKELRAKGEGESRRTERVGSASFVVDDEVDSFLVLDCDGSDAAFINAFSSPDLMKERAAVSEYGVEEIQRGRMESGAKKRMGINHQPGSFAKTQRNALIRRVLVRHLVDGPFEEVGDREVDVEASNGGGDGRSGAHNERDEVCCTKSLSATLVQRTAR